MRVLLLGITGNVGSRLLPALLAHKHQVVGFVRTPGKISPEVISKLDSIVVGSAVDSAAIKAAILSSNCDAVLNAAGLAAVTGWNSQGDFPAIFAAVVQATIEAGRERGGTPIRCWFMSGFTILDGPKKPYLLYRYLPLFPSHKQNFQLISSHPVDTLAWSLFCANNLSSRYDTPQFPPPTDVSASNIVAKADAPPAWVETYQFVPLIGNFLNVITQAQSYYSTIENCVDFIATDLEKGLQSEWIGKRVGVKEKSQVNVAQGPVT